MGKEDHQVCFEDFLIAEYNQLSEAFLNNEELGERRVNFFITLTTAVIGAFVAIWKVSDVKVDKIFFLFGLFALLLFGIISLVRIIRRNLATDKYLRALGRIRRYFADEDPKKKPFLLFPLYDDKSRKTEWKDIKSFGTGGLVEMVEFINIVIFVAIIALALYIRSIPKWIIALSAFFSFVVPYMGQFIYVMYRYNKEDQRIKSDESKFPSPKGD